VKEAVVPFRNKLYLLLHERARDRQISRNARLGIRTQALITSTENYIRDNFWGSPRLNHAITVLNFGLERCNLATAVIKLALGLLRLIRKYIFKEKVSTDAGEQLAARLRELAKPDPKSKSDEKASPKAS
jgi:hypothetical protein